MDRQLILGSGSPRRQEILRNSGYEFEVVVSGVDEVADTALAVEEIPEDLARQKAAHILPNVPNDDFVLLTSDTVVVLNGEIIGKPVDLADARSILEKLSGKTHQVISGVCLADRDRQASFSDMTSVSFHTLSDEEIWHYVSNFEVMDKAGAYAIQEWIGLIGITSIQGSYYNVMGLPVHRVYEALKNWGVYPAGLSK